MVSFALLLIIYLSFISLGLPDAVLGSAWPVMHRFLGVPVSNMGILTFIISISGMISSMNSYRFYRRLGTGKLTLISVGLTAFALLGFSLSTQFWMLLLLAVPYGLGAGGVDAALNNYVALHLRAGHMSWLHCFWGVGASIGPLIMGSVLSSGGEWSQGYLIIAILQITLTLVLLFTLGLWQKDGKENGQKEEGKLLTLSDVFKLKGARETMFSLFAYCALEQTSGPWAASYLVFSRGMGREEAAGFASLFFLGVTVGRFLSGFFSEKLGDRKMIRIGQGMILAGIILVILPLQTEVALLGMIILGFGSAPIYPAFMHATPDHFGKEASQAVIGIQMAVANGGALLMPPLFGVLSRFFGMGLFPWYLLFFWLVMLYLSERMNRIFASQS